MIKTENNVRKTSYSIDSVFTDRWSPRSFQEKDVPEEVLFSLFEAARWAPSANNKQPWRFIFAREQKDKEKFHKFILPANLVWAKRAPVLVLVISEKVQDGQELRYHAFDTGMASANFILEATKKGLITHFMGGIDLDLPREILEIPGEYEIQAVIAVGYQGEAGVLPENLQLREKPSDRKDIKEFVFEGSLT